MTITQTRTTATLATRPIPEALSSDQITRSGHHHSEAHVEDAAAGAHLPASQRAAVTQSGLAGGDQTGNGSSAAKPPSAPTLATSLSDPFLALAADVLDDLEGNRIANENRLRQLTRTESDVDGEERGFGLDDSHPDVARLAALVQMMKCDSAAVLLLGGTKPRKERGKPCCLEHEAQANLTRMLAAHALGPWMQAQKGVGKKQGARLLAVIGDPYLHPDGSPRTVSQLWAYCGHGDPARRRFKGMSQADLFRLGNTTAKQRLWLISSACLKAQGHYADVYYARKEATEGRTHAHECVRCGPSGKPAVSGSPWSDAHRHADALRVLGKSLLRDLWVEAKRIHEHNLTLPGSAS